jgi:hypothetical protein
MQTNLSTGGDSHDPGESSVNIMRTRCCIVAHTRRAVVGRSDDGPAALLVVAAMPRPGGYFFFGLLAFFFGLPICFAFLRHLASALPFNFLHLAIAFARFAFSFCAGVFPVGPPG